jgi:hypothetical protein
MLERFDSEWKDEHPFRVGPTSAATCSAPVGGVSR